MKMYKSEEIYQSLFIYRTSIIIAVKQQLRHTKDISSSPCTVWYVRQPVSSSHKQFACSWHPCTVRHAAVILYTCKWEGQLEVRSNDIYFSNKYFPPSNISQTFCLDLNPRKLAMCAHSVSFLDKLTDR